MELAHEGGLTQEDVKRKECEHGVRGDWRKRGATNATGLVL